MPFRIPVTSPKEPEPEVLLIKVQEAWNNILTQKPLTIEATLVWTTLVPGLQEVQNPQKFYRATDALKSLLPAGFYAEDAGFKDNGNTFTIRYTG